MPVRKPLEPTNAELAAQIGDVAADVSDLKGRVAAFNPNGTYAALKQVADVAPAVLKLAENVDPLVKLAGISDYIALSVEQRREQEIVWRWLKRTLNPLASKVGAVIWLLISAVVFSVVAAHIK